MKPKDLKIEFNGITFNEFHSGTEPEENCYVVNNLVEGFSSPQIKPNVSEYQFTHGASHGQNAYGRTTVLVTGHIVAEDQETQKNMKDALSYSLSLPMYRNPEEDGFIDIKIIDELGNVLTNRAKVFQAISYSKIFGDETLRNFIFGLEFERHYFLTEEGEEVTAEDRLFATNISILYDDINYLDDVDDLFITYDEGVPLYFDQGSVTFINEGNYYSPVIINIFEGAENPFIKNKTTGVSFKVNYTVQAGETLVIDGENSLVYVILSNGEKQDMSALVDLSAEWVFMDIGENELIVMDDSEYESNFIFSISTKSSFINI